MNVSVADGLSVQCELAINAQQPCLFVTKPISENSSKDNIYT